MELTKTEKQELQSTATFLKELPPGHLRSKVSPEDIILITRFWKILGNALDAYFSDTPNPIPNLKNVSENFKEEMQNWVDNYLNLSIFIFKTEHLIQQEARNRGYDLSCLKRSDLIKQFAYEHCCLNLETVNAKYYESLNKRQNEERTREAIKIFKGIEINETTKNRLLKEEKNISRLRPQHFGQELYLTSICYEIFKQKRNLPEAKKIAALGKFFNFKKFSVKDGVIEETPSRGKDKQKRKQTGSSES